MSNKIWTQVVLKKYQKKNNGHWYSLRAIYVHLVLPITSFASLLLSIVSFLSVPIWQVTQFKPSKLSVISVPHYLLQICIFLPEEEIILLIVMCCYFTLCISNMSICPNNWTDSVLVVKKIVNEIIILHILQEHSVTWHLNCCCCWVLNKTK